MMVKSLGDYNKEESSSSDVKNIRWTQRKSLDSEKPKKKKTKKKISPVNIIQKTKKDKIKKDKIFKVDEEKNAKKSKNKIVNKKFQKSSASYGIIEQGFKRPGR